MFRASVHLTPAPLIAYAKASALKAGRGGGWTMEAALFDKLTAGPAHENRAADL